MSTCLRNIGNKHVVAVIMRLSRIFQRMYMKAVDPNSKAQLMDILIVAEMLAILEREFPPSFFDIMVYMTVYLVEEVFICRLVHTMWMYPYER